MATKATLHALVDQLPETELDAAERYLAYLRDTAEPVERLLATAPEDEEPLSQEEESAIAEGWEAYRRGETRPWARVRDELAGE